MRISEWPLLNPIRKELAFRLKAKSATPDEVASLGAQWRRVLDNSLPEYRNLNAKSTRHVLFVTGYGLSPAMLSYESVLMMGLHIRGCRVSSLYCNTSLPACEFNSTGNNRPGSGIYASGLTRKAVLQTCSQCTSNIQALYPLLPIELHGYDRFLTPEDFRLAHEASSAASFENFRTFEFEGVNVGEEVFASVLRVTLCGTIEDTKKNRWLVSRFLYACTLMEIAARKAYTTLKPDRIVAVHGIYATHGIAAKVANHLGIPIIIFGTPYRKSTIWLSHNDSYHRTLMTEPPSIWNAPPLTAQERDLTWKYLISRQAGGRDYVSYHPNPVDDVETLYRDLRIDRSRKIISLFTNVIWDAQIYYNFNVFSNIFEWLAFSVRELAKNPNVWLVIRIHPAEVKGGMPTKQPILPEIRKLFPVLPPNVRIIPPESDLSSYTLAENSQAALIYGTKMGLEMAARGLPVAVCGETFSRGKGFTLDVVSQEQYRALLQNIHNLNPLEPEKKELAIQYAHYLFFRKMMDFSFVKIEDVIASKGIQLTFSDLSPLEPGRNRSLDVIMDGILNLKPLHLPATSLPG